MDDGYRASEWERIALATANSELRSDLRFVQVENKRLMAALLLAVGELSTHGQYAAWTPEMLLNHFLDEASHAS